MAGMGGTSFTYDVANRIATVLPGGGGTERYSYGPDNLRVWKLAADGTEELHFACVIAQGVPHHITQRGNARRDVFPHVSGFLGFRQNDSCHLPRLH
jgi:hypothetical protein